MVLLLMPPNRGMLPLLLMLPMMRLLMLLMLPMLLLLPRPTHDACCPTAARCCLLHAACYPVYDANCIIPTPRRRSGCLLPAGRYTLPDV